MARVLLIGIDYYAYIREIVLALERQGHSCDFHAIEPVDAFHKAIRNHAAGLYRHILNARHLNIIRDTAGIPYDTVLFIQCHHVSHSNMTALREKHREARFVLYNWDSLATHDFAPWLAHFDTVYTFDPEDASSLGVRYLPLFAIPSFFRVSERKTDFDLYFVGAIGTMDRFEALERLYAYAKAHDLRLKYHLKCSPPVRLRLWRRGKDLPGITGRSLDFEGIVDLLERSRATFDFANHRQSGYTMRFIENMCAGKKIVTENPRVLEEPFYREDRFMLVCNHDFSELPKFLDRPITSELDLRAYSVDAWVKRLLEE